MKSLLVRVSLFRTLSNIYDEVFTPKLRDRKFYLWTGLSFMEHVGFRADEILGVCRPLKKAHCCTYFFEEIVKENKKKQSKC